MGRKRLEISAGISTMTTPLGVPEAPADPHLPAQEFIVKWRERWPEWGIAEVFIPAQQRPLVAAWFALLQEWTLAAWAGREPAAGLAKLAWWQDELNGWVKGRRRHPLGGHLLTKPLPWAVLAQALNGLSVSRDTVPESIAAAVDLVPLAQALLHCEAVLFEAAPAAHHPILSDLLAEQSLLRGDAAAAARLLAERATFSQAPLPRRLQSAILTARLRQLHRGHPQRPPAAWRTLLGAWRAARALKAS